VTDWRLLFPALLTFASVSFGTLAVIFLMEGIRTARRRRMILARLQPMNTAEAEEDNDLLRPGELRSTFPALLDRVPWFRDLALRLRQAGVKISPQSFVLLIGGSGAAFGLLVWVTTLSPMIASVTAVGAALLPEIWLRQRRKRRLRKFEEQFPEAIDLLGRAIRAGHPLSAGIRMVADESPEPIAGEFRQAFEEQRFGLPFDDALLGLTDRNELMDVRIFVTAVLIQREVGGNLAEVLDKISQTVRARFAIQRQLRVYTAQGRLSGYVLGVMPIAVAAAIFAINRDYARMLITEPLGRIMVVIALVMQLLGYLWIRRIVDIEI
jgi:tight adherence protein B